MEIFPLQYIVMDLEWNTAYAKRFGSFFNEVIEIGAAKLDGAFRLVDTISILVRPQIGKKLRGRTKDLTHITNEDVLAGKLFEDAIREFSDWVGREENTFLTWGDGDIRVLSKNQEYFTGNSELGFMKNYADAQKYCQAFLKPKLNQQIGLSAACEQLGVDAEAFSHHRALDDSLMTVECLKKIFDSEKLKKYTHHCDSDFNKRLAFKPYYIRDINNPAVKLKGMKCYCDVCGRKAVQKKKWRIVNQSFRSEFYCPECKRNFRFSVRYKQYFDYVDIKKTYTEIKPKQNKAEKKSDT